MDLSGLVKCAVGHEQGQGIAYLNVPDCACCVYAGCPQAIEICLVPIKRRQGSAELAVLVLQPSSSSSAFEMMPMPTCSGAVVNRPPFQTTNFSLSSAHGQKGMSTHIVQELDQMRPVLLELPNAEVVPCAKLSTSALLLWISDIDFPPDFAAIFKRTALHECLKAASHGRAHRRSAVWHDQRTCGS